MTTTVTGSYETMDSIKNVQDELIAAGIPQEQIFVDKSATCIKVMIADVTEAEVEDIFKRHDPSAVTRTTH